MFVINPDCSFAPIMISGIKKAMMEMTVLNFIFNFILCRFQLCAII